MVKLFWFRKKRKITVNSTDYNMTVGQLKKKIQDLPDDSSIFYQRIEDNYFKPGKGWLENSVFKPSPEYPEFNDQYIQVFGAVKYKDDPNLYLTAHY